jgi:hypothetical protein
MTGPKLGPFGLMCLMICVLALFPGGLLGEEKLQIEVYGGIAFMNPNDLNLFSEAEQQYNELYVIQRLNWMQGYFVNDFPKIKSVLPGGLRIRYRLSSVFTLSMGVEGFFKRSERSLEGTFSYVYSGVQTERHTKSYDPFRLEVSGWSVLGGLNYRFPVGALTDLEVGAGAGWTFADFKFRSDWSSAIDFFGSAYDFSALDTVSLRGDGSGSGFTARAVVRLNRELSRRFALFVEAAGTYCRIVSLEGGGRESRNTTGEDTWEGVWGIKKEEIRLSWAEADVLAPTNLWEGWPAQQRERDFVLDLSRLNLVLGIQIRF